MPLAALAWLALAAPALGCPVCDGETGRLVRAGILDAQLVPNLLATGAPFVVFALLAAALHFGPWRGAAS